MEHIMDILIIEDDRDFADNLREIIEQHFPKSRIKTCQDFEKAKDQICELEPNLIVLDLIQNDASPDSHAPGMEIFKYVFKELQDFFCPIVVYSAQCERSEEGGDYHPFVRRVSKRSGTEDDVIQAIHEFKPYSDALRETQLHFRKAWATAMRDAAPSLFEFFGDHSENTKDKLIRASRRRIAAAMDEPFADSSLAPWEIYLLPPLSGNLQLGDIIKFVEGSNTEAESFCMVLTPSCDLVQRGTRTSKVSHLLAAKCVSASEGLQSVGLTVTKKRSSLDKLKKALLNPGHLNGILPLPRFSEKIPVMMADLRKLELIPLEKFKEHSCSVNDRHEYERIASIDSPFRELIAWAYMQVSARPGLPDRNFDDWANEIVEAMNDSDRENR